MQILIYFLPSREESDHVSERYRADRCGGNAPYLYQVPGFSLGRLPAILISSVPPGKFQDSGLPEWVTATSFVAKSLSFFIQQSPYHDDVQTILRHSQRRKINHKENNKITTRAPKFSQRR